MMDLKAQESAALRHQTQLTAITTLQNPFQLFWQEMSFQLNLEAQYWFLNSHKVRQIVKFYQSINQHRVSSPVGFKVGNHKVITTSHGITVHFTHPYQLKIMTNFFVYNLVPPKKQLILINYFQRDDIHIIQETRGIS
jgi:hypothetical protein